MLVVTPNGQVGVPAHCALGWTDVSSHELEERRLASSIGTHKGNSAVTVDAKLQILQVQEARRFE